MKKHLLTRASVLAGVLFSSALAPTAFGQSSDAIIDKLVDKGILTQQEAKELREEADHAFARAHAAKTGLPDWVAQMRIGGDIRGRAEHFISENTANVDRTRYRYRMRLGVTITMLDNVEAGLRLSSSEPSASFGGDPISGNTTFSGNGSKKFVYLDLAYGKWTPINSGGLTLSGTVGKMENPFVVSDMVFDGDYTPEGAALQASYQLNDHHTLKFNGAGFVLNELSGLRADTFMFGAQARWDGKYLQREGYYLIESALGASWYGINTAGSLTNGAVPNVNVGNTRGGGSNPLAYNYNPVVIDAALTYHLPGMPLYNGVFPVKLAGEYMHNPAAPNNNTGWWMGVQFGKAGKRRTWEVGYRFKHLEADAWYEEFVDSDFGAYYQAGQTGGASGYRAGTNVEGHIFKASYSPYDSLTFAVTYFMTDLINPSPAGSKSGMGRLQVDANWKF
ncbi:MAG: putative porin [Verrucomicrobia bacterium]|nr:putative porin [Verrucomicrobiota bacterium]